MPTLPGWSAPILSATALASAPLRRSRGGAFPFLVTAWRPCSQSFFDKRGDRVSPGGRRHPVPPPAEKATWVAG